jgi:hypothetical protein
MTSCGSSPVEMTAFADCTDPTVTRPIALCDNVDYVAHIGMERVMAKARAKARGPTARRPAAASSRHAASKSMRSRGGSGAMGATAALEDARQAGLLEGEGRRT